MLAGAMGGKASGGNPLVALGTAAAAAYLGGKGSSQTKSHGGGSGFIPAGVAGYVGGHGDKKHKDKKHKEKKHKGHKRSGSDSSRSSRGSNSS